MFMPKTVLARLSRFATAFLLLTVATPALAYEGAGIERKEDAPPPPKQPILTKPPAVATPVEAAYPVALLAKGAPGGSVTLIITIDAQGHVPQAKVTQSSGFPEMDESALTAIRQFLFTPAELDGKPAAIQLQYVFNFAPPPPPPPPPPDAPPPPPPVNLTGRVLERGTRDPLFGATVYLPGSDLKAETDAQGRFEIRGAPVGKVHVEITEGRHRKFTTDEEIKAGQVVDLTAYLWKLTEGGFEATVRGDREKKDVARRSLQREELTSVPGTFGDPIRVIQNLPGVARGAFISGALLVRGANPEDTSVLIDGVPIPLLFHFGGGPSVLNPSFIDHIDFYPGAFGAKYGRAIAGVVDVVTRPPEAKGYHGQVGIDLLQSNFYVEGPVWPGKDYGTWSLAARRSYIDLLLPPILNAVRQPGQAIFVAAPRYWDYQSRYDIKLGRHRLEFSVFGSDDILTLTQSGTAETQGFSVDTHQGFNRARIKWTLNTEDGWTFYAAPTIGNTIVHFDFNKAISGNISSIDFNTRAGARKEFFKGLSFETGIDLNASLFTLAFQLPKTPNYRTFPGEAPDTGSEKRNFLTNIYSQGAFAEVVWNPVGGLKFIPGVRFELYEQPKKTIPALEPRLGVRYEFSERTAIKAAWGLYHEAPSPMNLDTQTGNPNLGLQSSMQTAVGFEQQLWTRLSLDVQGYYNARSNLVVPSTTVGERFNNSGHGYAYGLEVLLKQDLTERMYGWIAYTLSRSEQWNETDKKYEVVDSDQTHILTIVFSYKFDYGIEAGARFRLTTGRPSTDVVGHTFAADTSSYIPIAGPAGAVRTPTFNQLDLRIEKLWTFDNWRFSVFLDVQNVYNAANPELILQNYRYTQSAPLSGLPILPTLGITGAF
jgi:TonB family protein